MTQGVMQVNRCPDWICAGIIPSLEYIDDKGKTRHEPKCMNPFLEPMVDELKKLWRVGALIHTYENPEGAHMHAMLLGVACDSPAARKISGFLCHSALYGCTKCYHKFSGKVGEKMYHGHDYDNWTLRDNKTHRGHCEKITRAETDSERSSLESKYGCRYSALLELTYFDAIRHTPIDAMHNLYLGIAKAFFELLVDLGILTDLKMARMTENLQNIYTNSGKSWLPKNIGSHWKFFNAYEWKQFTLVHSLQAFRGVLHPDYLKTWSLFVNACQLISKPCVSKDDVNQAHELFVEYVKQLEIQFGKQVIKPNHHMSLHLKECIEDFGGVYTTWLFAFERFNGQLGDNKTNNKGIEITLMRNIISDSILANKSFDLPKSFSKTCSFPSSKTCVFKPTDMKHISPISMEMSTMPLDKCEKLWSSISHVKVPAEIAGSALKSNHLERIDDDDLFLLCGTYQAMYPDLNVGIQDLSTLTKKFKTVDIGCETFTTYGRNERKMCLILAKWCNDSGLIDADSVPRLGFVKYFFQHNLRITAKSTTHIVAAVQWYTDFHDSMPTGYLPPVQIFRKKSVKPGPASFMPVQRILSKCAYSIREVNKYSNCIVVSPVPFDVYI